MSNACATCAITFDSPLDPLSEKPLLPGRHLDCCSRSICSKCLAQNKRYETYCPYCQITTVPSPLPQRLRDPPAYSDSEAPAKSPLSTSRIRDSNQDEDDRPPAYTPNNGYNGSDEKSSGNKDEPAPDVLHFVTPDDTMSSLALAYGVPLPVLRKTNNVYSDHLIQARRTVLIPGEYYKGGVSLSPRPIEGEEEEIRRGKIRKWMITCKVAEYDVALLYLDNADWSLDAAVDAFQEDERWEKEHPLKAKERQKQMGLGKGRGKNDNAAKVAGMRRFVGETTTEANTRRRS